MAAITATFWTITEQKRVISGAQKRVLVKAVLAAGTCPSAGAPGATFSVLGLAKYLTNIIIVDSDDSNSMQWKYDQANNKFRPVGFRKLASGVNVVASGGVELNLASGRAAFGSTGAAITLTGVHVQLPTTITVAEQTMYLEAVGW